ncbi:MAG: J domain-containing protein [Streptosporangiaceae bacterium]|nr:J domain-containing protein [Streptosporangiaceae bacterium]
MPGSGQHQQRPDLYGVLGLDQEASRADIIRAYRQQARAMHPDARPDDPDAAARFQALTDAYDVLSDPARRDAYDRRNPGPGVARPAAPGPPARAWATSRPRGAGPSGATIWAGPVHVQPPGGPAQAQPPAGAEPGLRGDPVRLPPDAAAALLADLISRYFDDEPGWPLWQ